MRQMTGAFLGVSVAAMLAGGAMAQNVDGPEVFWKWSVWGNPRAFTAGAEHLAERVAEETGGKFKIQMFYGEQLAKAKEHLDAIKNNAVEAAFFCHFYHPGKNPAFMVFTLPFVPLGDWEVSQYVRNELYKHPALVADMDQWNAMTYVSTLLPQYEFLGVGEPPMELEDWKGLRVRAGGGVGDAMEVLGASLQTVPASEVYTLMQRGAIDAASLPYSYAHESYKIHELADWFTANMQPGSSECPMVINKTAWEALPDQYKKLVEDLKPEVTQAMIDAYKETDSVNIPMFEEMLTKIEYSDEQLDEFRTVAGEPVWEKWVQDNQDKFDAQGVLDRMWELIEEARAKGM
jgi:TRAP-type mannitol/chloroaromatic compound transport system substrate-binding protein